MSKIPAPFHQSGPSPWHDVSVGDKASEGIVKCLVEIPMGSSNKYEIDKETGLLCLDRVLHSAVYYPANYGFIPQTLADDGDPLDILVLGAGPVYPLTLVTARAIGIMLMKDQDELDHKVIAVPLGDPESTTFPRIGSPCFAASSRTTRPLRTNPSSLMTFFPPRKPFP